VEPFDEEYALEPIQGDGVVDLLEFWGILVFGKLLFPGLLPDRRQYASDWIPFDDR